MTSPFFQDRNLQSAPHHEQAWSAGPAVTCGVCGGHTFEEDSPHEFAHGISDRLICAVCGAHRLLAQRPHAGSA